MTNDRLVLLDTASLYFRAFYSLPASVTAPDGTPVNAVRGLLDAIARFVTELRPDRLVACLDADWRPAWRVSAIPSYKAHRVADAAGGTETVPDELSGQVPIIEAVLDAVGIARLGVADYEADDVIAALATRHDGPVDIVTGDRDLFQLVDDARLVRVIYTGKGGGIVDEAAVTRRYGIPGRAYADFAVLRGDPSDGLPGVRGVGDKTAAKLIAAYGDLAGLRSALDTGNTTAMPRGCADKLRAAADYLAAAETVVRAATKLALPDLDDRLPHAPRDPAALEQLDERWALGSSQERLLTALRDQAD
jgi:5'-3' exonuclease